jgi:transposase
MVTSLEMYNKLVEHDKILKEIRENSFLNCITELSVNETAKILGVGNGEIKRFIEEGDDNGVKLEAMQRKHGNAKEGYTYTVTVKDIIAFQDARKKVRKLIAEEREERKKQIMFEAPDIKEILRKEQIRLGIINPDGTVKTKKKTSTKS